MHHNLNKLISIRKFDYIPAFDGIRSVAVLFVLLLHCSYGFFKGGWVGVDLFFVLSGFLITSLLKTEYNLTGQISLPAFWFRRALKLIPPLVLTIVLVNIFWLFLPGNTKADRYLASSAGLFYFSNFINPILLGPLSHLWSLSVEEHFYFCWPLLLQLVLLKKDKRFNELLLTSLIIIAIIFRIIGYYYYGRFNNPQNVFELDPYRSTVFRMDSILMGCGLGLFYSSGKYLKKQIVLFLNFIVFLFFIIALLYLDQLNIWFQSGGLILVNIFCVLAIYIALIQPAHFFFAHPLSRYIGKRSYGIYLYHFPIFLLLENMRVNHSISNLILVTALRFLFTFLIAELSYRYVERPILSLKGRLKFSNS